MKSFVMTLLLCLAVAGCNKKAEATDISQSLSIVTKTGARHDFKVELALTPLQQERGLMNRTEMAKNAGMLFFFADEGIRSFWMKNTLIPLDMVFIKRDGTIVNIHDSAVPGNLTSVSSTGPAMAVLELNGGVSKTLGIQAGDKVHHLLFGNALAR